MRAFGILRLVVLGSAIGLAGCDRDQARSTIMWDLSEDRDISRVEWPADVRGDTLLLRGDYDFTLKTSDGFSLRCQAFLLSCRRAGREVDYVNINFNRKLSVQEAADQARKLMADLDFRRAVQVELENWRRSGGTQRFEAMENHRNPAVAVAITNTNVAIDRTEGTCSLNLQFNWDPQQP